MKIVMIHGQNHKGSTYHLGKLLVEKIGGEKEIKEFFLPKDLNHFCTGCYACLQARENCPYWNEKQPMMDAVLKADLLVFTTPNYCMMPSAPMKAFLDLFFTNWLTHKPYKEMFSKQAVVISTAAGSGAKKAATLVANNLQNWGIPMVTVYGINANTMGWETMPQKKKAKAEKDITRMARRISTRKSVRVGLKTRALFWFYGGMQKANWGAAPEEKQYWTDMGWLNGKKPWKP